MITFHANLCRLRRHASFFHAFYSERAINYFTATKQYDARKFEMKEKKAARKVEIINFV